MGFSSYSLLGELMYAYVTCRPGNEQGSAAVKFYYP